MPVLLFWVEIEISCSVIVIELGYYFKDLVKETDGRRKKDRRVPLYVGPGGGFERRKKHFGSRIKSQIRYTALEFCTKKMLSHSASD
jgi:hypothetical protein